MKTGLHFLIAAKRCEIAELQELTQTSALVRVTARLVHGLQRERGLSNLFLASPNGHWQPELDEQVAACVAMQQELLDGFGSMDIEPRLGQGARLFSRIAYVMQGLDALPALRQQVRTRAWTPQRATQAYIRLINGLLAVVFEAADSAGDPDISRRLVALFNFMQGKELAGQERASGAAAFGSGRADAATQQHLLHLIDSQERCLQVFADFASDDLKRAWQQAQQVDTLAGLERLRRVICTAAPGQVLDTGQTQMWFDACTARMDAMKGVEDRLADELQGLCAQRQELARGELAVLERMLVASATGARAVQRSLSFFEDNAVTPLPPSAPAPPTWATPLDRSILDLVQEQARRLQTVSDELDTVRASLNERKLIERAKGLLMAHRHLGEEAAHKTMRQMAMNQNKRLVEVAEAVLAMADVLPSTQR
jgi:hypothetical protein